MKAFVFITLLSVFTLFSCGTIQNERKPVPPQGSAGDMPWNRPQSGEGQGGLGGMLQSR